tara:strand:+ start:8074 stop:8907 length:834 start_codon:yes stop_codon:yes gene_type:complete
MKVLITGASGFLGKEFIQYFQKDYELIPCTRKDLDVTDSDQVHRFFEENDVDIILHTAFVGGKRQGKDTFDQFCDNVSAFNNLLKYKKDKHHLFCFGSGASYDRRTVVKDMEEGLIFYSNPQDYYGKAKNLISRIIYENSPSCPVTNVYDFRLFGCFGKFEEESRFIKNVLASIRNNTPITIHKNKVMDFFYVKDLCRVIEFYLQNEHLDLPRSLNICYSEKHTLLDIANMIVEPNSHLIRLSEPGLDYYTGSGRKLSKLPIPLLGLQKGIEEMQNE